MLNNTQAKRLDQALLLATGVNVSADATLTYVFTKGNNSPVNTSTWQTQDALYRTLEQAYGYLVDLYVYFDTAVFTTTNSKVEVTVRQKRFTTDTSTTAPIIGAATLCADGLDEVASVGLRVPLAFVKFAPAQASHGLFVTVDTTTVTLTTASLWLAGAEYATNQ